MRVHDKGSTYGVSINADEIASFRDRWPASGLQSLRSLFAEFDRKNDDLIDLECNGKGSCERFDGAALAALTDDMKTAAKARFAEKTRSRGFAEVMTRHDTASERYNIPGEGYDGVVVVHRSARRGSSGWAWSLYNSRGGLAAAGRARSAGAGGAAGVRAARPRVPPR